ncbi:MAG: hypothetical protein MUP24_01780 [Gillisia sp.]|nr:hypothetical protein [Gillisia sp.]
MRNILIILLILISTLSFSQNNSEFEIFRKVIAHEIRDGSLYLQCEKQRTFFDLKNFKNQTLLQIPENILIEITTNAKRSEDGIWKSGLLKELKYGSDIKSNECLSKEDAEQLFQKTGKRQNIVSISDPIFDDNYENCVVSVTYSMFKGSVYGRSYFLKKVYGVWTIITEYNMWLS